MKDSQLYFSFVDLEISETEMEAFAAYIAPVIKQILDCYGTSQYIFTDFPDRDDNFDEKYSIPVTICVGDRDQSYFPFMRKLEEERWAFCNCLIVFDYEIIK